MVQDEFVDPSEIAYVDCINHKTYMGKLLDGGEVFEMIICKEDKDFKYFETDMKAAIIRDNVVAIRTITNRKT